MLLQGPGAMLLRPGNQEPGTMRPAPMNPEFGAMWLRPTNPAAVDLTCGCWSRKKMAKILRRASSCKGPPGATVAGDPAYAGAHRMHWQCMQAKHPSMAICLSIVWQGDTRPERSMGLHTEGLCIRAHPPTKADEHVGLPWAVSRLSRPYKPQCRQGHRHPRWDCT